MLTEQQTISVIVPVYNTAPYLEVCVKSILCQTYPHLELLLVDDGSTDESPALCERLAAQDGRIRVLHKPNGGLSDARNFGMGHARGSLFAFADSDDALHPQMLDLLIRAMEQTGASLAMGLFNEVTDLPEEHPVYDPRTLPICRKGREEIFRSITVEYVVAWNKLYRRELFEDIRYPVGRLHEDEFVAHRLLWKAEQVARVDLPLYDYRQRPQSIMHTAIDPRRLDGLAAMRERVEFCLEQGRPDLACRSVDSLLGVTESLLRRQDAMTPEARDLFVRGIREDARRWPQIQNRTQKQRWQWLCTLPAAEYFARKERQERRARAMAALKKPLKALLGKTAGQEESR